MKPTAAESESVMPTVARPRKPPSSATGVWTRMSVAPQTVRLRLSQLQIAESFDNEDKRAEKADRSYQEVTARLLRAQPGST